MVNDNFSCIKVVTKVVHITIFSSYHSNEITHISNVLESWKRQYVKQLQGIVVSYKNVYVMSKSSYVKLDCPVIHCNVKATFELFIPTVGSIIKGKVNRISHDYIGCLIHNSINAAIYRSRGDSSNVFIALEQMILFEITHLGFKRKIIRVKGKITQECINLMQELNLLLVDTDDVKPSMLTEATSDSNVNSTVEESEKSDADTLLVEEENLSQSLLCNTADIFRNLGDISSNSPKVKRKKSNKSQTENSDGILESLANGGELSSLSYNTETSSVVSSDSPKKKKSKKLDIEQSTNRLLESLENGDKSLSLLSYNTESSVVSSDSSKKKKKKSNKLHVGQSSNRPLESSESYDLMEIVSCDPSVENQLLQNEKFSASIKKAEKRKRESPDKDGLPKKKIKTEENKSASLKTSKKHKAVKTEKKKKKSKKDSKKDKKKSKKKVISTKKKLPKLKKKKKEKGEKLKKKKSKKSSKQKEKNMP